MPRMFGYRLPRKGTAGVLLLTRQESAKLAGSHSIVFRSDLATARLMARRSAARTCFVNGLATQVPALGRNLKSEPQEEL